MATEPWIEFDGNRPPVLADGDVHVWRASLDTDAERMAAFESSLAPDERERAARFRFAEHRRRYVAARGILRSILGGYLRREPSALVFAYGDHGKPRLAEPSETKMEFNVSHSADLAVFGFASGRRVGVDVEFVKPGVSCMKIAEHYFSENETAALRALPGTEMRAKFYELWSEKEALLKALGVGLQFGLEKPQPGGAGWSSVKLEPAAGYAAALAVEDSAPRVTLFHFV